MAKYRIIYWKHIPQSFTVEGDGRTVKKQLSQKIQNKIDAYAMAEATDFHIGLRERNTNAETGSNAKAHPRKLRKRFFPNWRLSSPKLKFRAEIAETS